MNRLTSLLQIKKYKARPLLTETHQELQKTIKFFTPDASYNRLTWTYWFKKEDYSVVLEQMGRIGWTADDIDHHPEWKLTQNTLEIALSTHDIGNKISLKDYILATYIESVLMGEKAESALLKLWNKKNVSAFELLG
jgi:4a-hydroxytetrahydrobiopterin dehydratase